jgi:anaerobic magnesium-protoporphyrin IX monomethyl ester cyclase
MRIALIWPHACTVYHTLPLSLGLLFSSIRGAGHDVRLFNLPLEGWTADSPDFHRAIADFRPDMVGATAWPMAFPSALAAVQATRARCPEAIYVLGGNYATLNPQQSLETGAFDYVVTGEAERLFPAFVAALAAGDRAAAAAMPGVCSRDPETGQLIRNRNVFHSDMDSLGAVDYDFIELDRAIARGYMRTILGPARKLAMFATRGCEYACNFCTAPIMNGTKLRHYSVEYLTTEIRKAYERHGIRQILFMDDNATQDVPFFKDLCRGIISLGFSDLEIELYRGVRLENLDEEMVRLMKRANFKVVTIAPESGSERVRKLMKKDMATADIHRAARLVKEAGLWLQAYFIVGYPGETPEERQESYRLIDELDLDIFELHKYMAIPGTGSFLKLVKLGKVRRDHTEETFIQGDAELPDYNGDGAQVDRELFMVYANFYLRKPQRAFQLLRLVSVGGLWRSLHGMTKAAARTLRPGATGEEGPGVVWRPS